MTDGPGAADGIEMAVDHLAESLDERGLHLFDLDKVEWEQSLPRPGSGLDPSLGAGVVEKWLIRPVPGDDSDDRFPVSYFRFPPNYVFPRHWHTEGELIIVVKGTANFAGHDIGPGAIAYSDARTIYGAEAAGPDGCEFLLIRRAYAQTILADG